MKTLRQFYFYGFYKVMRYLFGANYVSRNKSLIERSTNVVITFHFIPFQLVIGKIFPRFFSAGMIFCGILFCYDFYVGIKYYWGERYLEQLALAENTRSKYGASVFILVYAIFPLLFMLYLGLPVK